MIDKRPASPKIAVVIPCYRVTKHILAVIDQVGPEVEKIYIVDDACPDRSGHLVKSHCSDQRVEVLFNTINLGVGGATLAGMRKAAETDVDIIVKIDGDGQMDPTFISVFTNVIYTGEADYVKGNRFYDPDGLKSMPRIRIFGNTVLSFLAKLSTGYWDLFDPNNGFIAIHRDVFQLLHTDKIAKRYFFESDILFRLNIMSAKVVDIPMNSYYADEISHLNPLEEIPRFSRMHARNYFKRIFYRYFIRDFNIASVQLLISFILITFGFLYGISNWGHTEPATAGTVMTAALPLLVGFQLFIAFLTYDLNSTPRQCLHTRLKRSSRPRKTLQRTDVLKLPYEGRGK